MVEKLLQTLETLGYPVLLQGSMAKDSVYPDHFFTFWNNASDSTGYYNNVEHGVVFNYDVNFYSVDPIKVYSTLNAAINNLKKQGFVVSGRGHSVISDEPTHDGRGTTVLYMETITN